MSGTLNRDLAHPNDEIYDIQIKDSRIKRKKNGFEKNSKEMVTIHKKHFYSKF